jgi:hypothetical protein
MTQFEQAIQAVEMGTLKTPTVSTSNGDISYFGYQLAVHHFNLKILAKGMTMRGVKLKTLKDYYGLKGKSAVDCLAQFEILVANYKARYQNN